MRSVDVDGVAPILFSLLSKESKKMSPASIFIPHTVIFDHGFASAWYYSSPSMELKRKGERDIGANEIWKEFAQNVNERENICALFIRTLSPDEKYPGEDTGKRLTLTQYWGKQELHDFLFNPGDKPQGILQQFLYPKGWCSTAIHAIWSPQLFMVEGVRNPYIIFDKTKTTSERAATFESPLSMQVSVTNSVYGAVKTLCNHIVDHLRLVDGLTVNGMVLCFKVDKQNRVNFLFSTSLRATVEGSIFQETTSKLNLHHDLMAEEEFMTSKRLKEYVGGRIEQRKKANKAEQVVNSSSSFRFGNTAAQSTFRRRKSDGSNSTSTLVKGLPEGTPLPPVMAPLPKMLMSVSDTYSAKAKALGITPQKSKKKKGASALVVGGITAKEPTAAQRRVSAPPGVVGIIPEPVSPHIRKVSSREGSLMSDDSIILSVSANTSMTSEPPLSGSRRFQSEFQTMRRERKAQLVESPEMIPTIPEDVLEKERATREEMEDVVSFFEDILYDLESQYVLSTPATPIMSLRLTTEIPECVAELANAEQLESMFRNLKGEVMDPQDDKGDLQTISLFISRSTFKDDIAAVRTRLNVFLGKVKQTKISKYRQLRQGEMVAAGGMLF